MAVNPVAGFSPDPMSQSPSAGMYTFADGTELYADDPELYGQVAAPSDMAGGGGGSEVDKGLAAYGAPPVPQVPQSPEAPAIRPEQVAAQGQAANQALAGTLANEQKRQQEEEFWRTHKIVPGRAGISQEQLRQQSESGVELPVGGTTQIQMGTPDTEEAKEAREQVYGQQSAAREAEAEYKKSQLVNKMAHLDKDTMQIEEEVNDQQMIRDRAAKEVKQRMGLLDKAEQEYREHKVDPDRYFNQKGGFAKIASVIGQALGAYGAALAGTQNWAQQIVDNLIERDIAAQRLEREQLGDAADNAYTRLVMATGDEDEAADMLRATQQRLTAVEREKFAAEAGIPAEDVALQQWDADHLAQRQAHEAQIAKDSQDRIVKSVQSQVAYPRAAVGGGIRQKTREEIQKDVLNESNFNTTLAENAAKRAKAGETVADAAGGGKVRTDPLYVEGYGQAASGAEASALRGVMADKKTTDEYLGTVESFLQKSPTDRTQQDYADYNIAVQRLEDAEAKAISGGVGSIQIGEREAARERGFEEKKYSAVPIGEIVNRTFDFGLTSGSQKSQLAKVKALRKNNAERARKKVNEIVQGQHPEVPTPGVAEE